MKVNILAVDDRPEGLLAVEAVLKDEGYNLVMASSGADALKALLKDDFAVILLDVQMPGMNGFEVAEIIKTRERSRNIPIVFMSAISQDEQYVYQGYEVGAIDYIMKPFDPYILKSKVEIFVDLYRKNIQLMEQAQRIHENEIRSYAQALDRLELESLRKYQYLADAIPQIVFRLLPDGSHEYFNRVWFEYTGFSIERSQGKGWKDAVHPDDLAALYASIQYGTGYETECRILSSKGEYRWHLVQLGAEKYSDASQVDAWLGTATDIEERKRNESFQRFLVNAGNILVSSLDYRTNFASVADLAIEEISDCCGIDLINENGELESLVFRGGEIPALERAEVVTTGQSIFHPELIHPELGECSLIIVPMSVQEKALGTLTLLYKDSKHTYHQGHLKTAEELGRRCAMALQNSKLYELSQQAIEVRNDFLSIASHELNTPMTSLKMQLQMVQKILDTKDQKDPMRFVKSIGASLRQVDRVIGLIQVLLDVSQIQSGKFNFFFQETSLPEIVQEVVGRHREIFVNSGAELSVGDIPEVTVKWDKMRIEQVLINLLMNSVKYAPGKIELTVKAESENVLIEVRDFGKGICSEKIGKIFDRFTRATSDSVAGLGLGLYIVKQIIEGHSGTIEVDSTEAGSVFKVKLPYEKELSIIKDLSEENRVALVST